MVSWFPRVLKSKRSISIWEMTQSWWCCSEWKCWGEKYGNWQWLWFISTGGSCLQKVQTIQEFGNVCVKNLALCAAVMTGGERMLSNKVLGNCISQSGWKWTITMPSWRLWHSWKQNDYSKYVTNLHLWSLSGGKNSNNVWCLSIDVSFTPSLKHWSYTGAFKTPFHDSHF